MANSTFILRFSDSKGIDTIDAHQKIIRDHGMVYWGWWKKDFENFPDDLNVNEERKIWIIEREKRLFYTATCTNIVVDRNRNKMISPNKEWTPTYYSNKKQPAWFALTSLAKAEERDYRSECGGVPVGDETLVISGSKREIELPAWDAIQHGQSILHISDVHFGQFHNYRCQNNLTETSSLLDVIVPKLTAQSIALIVASGDFTTRGNKNKFTESQNFLCELLRELDIENERLIIVPGNHDRFLDDKAKGDSFDEYRNFRHSLLGVPKERDLVYLRCFCLPSGKKVTFSCLNSAKLIDENNKKEYQAYGKVDIEQCEELLRMLLHFLDLDETKDLPQTFLARGIINFCVIHHHMKRPDQHPRLDPEDKKDISLIINSRKFENLLLKYGIRFLLHGHQHVAYPSVISNRDVETGILKYFDTLGAGSVGAHLSAGYDGFPWNSFSIYTPQDTQLEIQIVNYNKDGSQQEEKYAIPY